MSTRSFKITCSNSPTIIHVQSRLVLMEELYKLASMAHPRFPVTILVQDVTKEPK